MRDLSAVTTERISGMGRSPLRLAALLLVVLAVVACGPAASTPEPDAQPDAGEEATLAPTLEPTAVPTALATDTPAPEAITPAVTVDDQAIEGGVVTVAQVVSAGPGWLVIHADRDGSPGSVLGYSPVVEGDNTDVMVTIDAAQATETLYAMLHVDAGEVGTYEFPGADGPVLVDDRPVTPAFSITGGLDLAPDAEPTAAPEPTAQPTAEPAGVFEGEAEVELEDFQFVPRVLTVKAGTRVKFANKDDVTHTATSDTGVFDSGSLGKGDEYFYTFTEAGEFPYYCAPHGGPGGVGMSATIIVVP